MSAFLKSKRLKVNPGIPTASLIQHYEAESEARSDTSVIPPIGISEENIAMAVENEIGRPNQHQNQRENPTKIKENGDKKTIGNDPFSFLEFIKAFPNTNEFVYLVSVSQGQSTYNPYNLLIVDYFSIDTKNPEGYYTMSAQVHFK